MKASCAMFFAVLFLVTSLTDAGDLEEYQAQQDRELRDFSAQKSAAVSARTKEYGYYVSMSTDEFAQWKKKRDKEFTEFAEKMQASWGSFRAPSNKKWVEYSSDGLSVTEVDFETGRVIVEALKGSNETDAVVRERLAVAVLRAVTSHGSMSNLPVEPTTQKGEVLKAPVLEQQVENEEGVPVTVVKANDFAAKIVPGARSESARLETEKITVTFNLVPNHLKRRMTPYIATVKKYSAEYGVEAHLILATIHTESYFNPMARSSCGAIGLMQLMPDRGGLEAYRYVYSDNRVPSEDFLLDTENNIRLGCAYVYILRNQYFLSVREPQSKQYCGIAGYNTGPGNVARAFCGTRKVSEAVLVVNKAISPEHVYGQLLRGLPYVETRAYLRNVVERMEIYR